MQRLHKNHGAYHGETINIRAVLREVELVARSCGWCGEVFHAGDGFQWFAWQRPPTLPSAQPLRVYLSAGIHGDEPAGPLAALQLLRDNQWPAHAEIVLLPCLNPIGFANNQRENAQGIDLNRDYLQPQSREIRAHLRWLEGQGDFSLSLCLHEDWEAQGFYLYELNPDQQPSVAEKIIAAAATASPIDQSELIEGRVAHGGIIRPSLDPQTRLQWPESFWLLQHKTRLAYTLEAASDYPLAVRVAAVVAAVQAACAGPPV